MATAEKVINVLLIEDEDFDVRRVENTLRPFSERIRIRKVVSNGRVALDLLAKSSDSFDVVIMDFQIAGGIMGENLIREMKKIDAALQIIVITKMTVNIADFHFADSLMKAGAYWYCTKYPGDIDEYIYQPTDFILSIINAYNKSLLEKERSKTTTESSCSRSSPPLDSKQIIGASNVSRQLKTQIEKVRRIRRERSHLRIIGNGEGTGRAAYPSEEQTPLREFCADQLRQYPVRTGGERTVRIREGFVHRCECRQDGTL
jgi:two-component system response regulator AtoC